MFRLMRKDHSKGSRSEEKKKKILKSSKESAHTDVTSVDLQEMEKGDVEQEGRRLFWDDQAKRNEKRKVMLKDFSKLQIKAGQGVVEAEQQEPIVCSRSMPATHNTPDNFCNQEFDSNLNSNQDGSESKVGNENSPNGSVNPLQGVSHALPSSDSVGIHPSLSNTKTSETELAIEQALISRDVLVDTPQVNQYNNPCRGPSQTGTDSCSVTDPELNHNNTSGGSQSGIHNNSSSNINTPSGHQQELKLAAETTPLVEQGTVNGPVQNDSGFIPSHASEGVSGRSTEGTSLGDQATGTSVAGVSASSLANTVAQHRNMTTESSSKKPSTGYDFSNNVGKIDSPDGVPQEHSEYILDTSSYPSFPPTPAPKPESTNPPSAMQIVGQGLFQKKDTKKLTVDDQFIEEAVTDNTLFLEKLSKYLDRESRVIKCWKHLAFVLNVPGEETRKFDMYTEHSPTEDMFNYLTDIWNPDLKVKELKMKLRTIYRNDVIDSLIKGGYHDEMMVAALISGEPKFIAMLSSKLDKDSRTIGNWKSLATQFGIRKQMTEQFGLRGLGPTAALFEHMSTADGLKDLTMSELREHFDAMERKDLINILKRHKFEDSQLVRTVVIKGSELLTEIGERLNKEMRAVKNWRNLAYRLKIPHEEYDSFDTSKGAAKSPTKLLFEWLKRWKPDLTVKDLLDGLKQIDRYDVVDLVQQEVATAGEKNEVDGATRQSTAKQVLWKLQQLHHYPDKSHKKTDLFTDLERKAAAKGLRIVDNEGNGNCMFSALCRQLEIKKGQRYSEMGLRTELVQYLKDHPTFDYRSGSSLSLFNFVEQKEYPTWTEYLQKMARDGTWGDHLILEAAARHLNCVIHIISSHPEFDVKIEPDLNSTTCDVAELLLGHIYEYHYVSLEADLSVPSYPSQLPTTNQQVPVSTYAGHPPSATHLQTYGNQQSQGHHQSERYSKEVKESMKVRKLPLKIYSKICMKLNIRRDWSFDDFRMVAEELGMDRDTTEFIGQHRNPTDSLFVEYYTSVTVLQLINILHKIERLDVAAILEEWIKDVQ